VRPPRLRCTLFPLIYPPHLLVLPATFGLHLRLQTYPYFRALYAISVRRTKSLPMTSFRFHLTMNTLVNQLYTSSLPRRIRDFHPLERAHGAQTNRQKKPPPFLPEPHQKPRCHNHTDNEPNHLHLRKPVSQNLSQNTCSKRPKEWSFHIHFLLHVI